jgi:hypothetical protein
VSCRDCDEKARAHAELDGLAQAWIAAGKLRGFVEGVEWAVKALDHMAPQAAAARPWERLWATERLVRALGPALLAKIEQRRIEALQAEHAARALTGRAPTPASRRGVRDRLRAAVLAALR